MYPVRHDYLSDLYFVETFFKYSDQNELVEDVIPDYDVDFEFVYRAEDNRTFVAGCCVFLRREFLCRIRCRYQCGGRVCCTGHRVGRCGVGQARPVRVVGTRPERHVFEVGIVRIGHYLVHPHRAHGRD